MHPRPIRFGTMTSRDPGFDAQSSMIGLWGPLYPRQGRAFHGSDVVASALLSYRAMDLSAGVDGKEIQLGYPTQTGCMTPGTRSAELGLQQRKTRNRRKVSLGLLDAGDLLHPAQLREDRCSTKYNPKGKIVLFLAFTG